MTEKEFVDLVDELRRAANMWFRKEDILKLERLIELAVSGNQEREERRGVALSNPKMKNDHAAS